MAVETLVREAVAARVAAAVRARARAAVRAVPTSTRYRWCKSCSGREADTGSCLLCLCNSVRTVWAALAELCH